jgi:hypothetical protein
VERAGAPGVRFSVPSLGFGLIGPQAWDQRLFGWGSYASVSVLAVQALALSAAIRMRPFAPFSFYRKALEGSADDVAEVRQVG